MASNRNLSDDGHWAVVSLRAVGAVSALSVIISLAWAIDSRHKTYGSTDPSSAFDYMVLAASAVYFLYTVIALIVRLVLRHSMHPGMYIGFDVVAFGIMIVMTVLFWVMIQPYQGTAYSCPHEPCNLGNVQAAELFGGVMALIICAIHLTTFCWSLWAAYSYRESVPDEISKVESLDG